MSNPQDAEDLAGYHSRQTANEAENRLSQAPSGRPGSWVTKLLIAGLLIGFGWVLRGLFS